MRRVLIFSFILFVTAALPANAPACHQGHSSKTHYSSKSHHQSSLESAFYKMDVNRDGLLTQSEFVAAHQKKMGTAQAAAKYTAMAAKGGTTTQSGTTGMTLQQFKAAHKSHH